MSDNFYKAFEDRYRGSRATIKARLSAYLPFLAPLARLHAPASALDLGCGRGEWLELTGEHGFTARGVDLDDGMLSSCRKRGLQVETADAIATLRALPADSVALVSAFHLVEHIPFDAVQELIREALRALQPGGLLILETPNPENLSVGAHSFYLDPSHLRPLPPELMLFAVEFAGFARQRIVRLQEDPALRTASVTRLQQVLDGVSPDYAIVAQKAAPPASLAPFDAAFATDFGLSFGTMAQRFDRQEDLKSQTIAGLSGGLQGLAGGLANLESHVAPLVERRTSADAELLRLFAAVEAQVIRQDADRGRFAEQLAAQRANFEQRLAAADARTDELARLLAMVLDSWPWRLMAPFRFAIRLARRVRNAKRNGTLLLAFKRRVRGIMQSAGQRLLRNRAAKRIALAMLVPFPRLHARLRAVMAVALLEASLPTDMPQAFDDKLSPRARQLVGQLQQVFKQKDQ